MTTLELERAGRAEDALAQLLEGYLGEWVAVREHAIVAHAPTLKELLGQIDPEETDRILKVPSDESAAALCFF